MVENKEIVERIRTICKEKDTSLTKLEESFHWSNGYIGKWKNAKRRPTIEKLSMIANKLGVSVSDLTGEEEIIKPDLREAGPGKQELLRRMESMSTSELLEVMQKATDLLREKDKAD